MKSRQQSFTMSTDKRKKKRRFPRVERIKIIEYGLIALVVLAFIGLAVYYGTKGKGSRNSEAIPTVSSAPTADTSIRGMNVLNALERGGFAVSYRDGAYAVTSPDGVGFDMRMQSDDKGILTLSFETILCADIDDDTELARILNAKNRSTADALQNLFDCIMPVFRRPAADVDTIVKQCRKVVLSGETYAKHLTRYSLRIESDPDADLQTVKVSLIRDP